MKQSFRRSVTRALLPFVVAFSLSLATLAQVTLPQSLLASVALHAVVLFWKFYSDYTNPYSDSSSGTPSGSAALQVQINPKAPLDTPSGWTPAVSPSIQPTPPAIPLQTTYGYSGGGNGYGSCYKAGFANAADRGQAAANCLNSVWGVSYYSSCNGGNGISNNGGACQGPSVVGTNCSGQNFFCLFSSANSCPSGYTSSGGQCVVSTPGTQWKPADGKCVWTRGSSGWSADAYDPDCLTPNKNVSATSNTLTVNSADGNTQTVFTLNTSNNTVSVQRTSSNGVYTQYETQTTSTPDSTTGAVTSTGQSLATASGGGSLVGTQVSGTGAAPTGTGTGSFPSDYAKAGEATTAAGSVVSAVNANTSAIGGKLDTLHTDLTTSTTAPADPTVPDSSGFDNAFFKGTFSGLLAWQLPSHTSQCPTATFDYVLFGSSNHLVMDAQCTIAEQVRPILSTAAVVMWTLVALFVVLGA